MPVLVSGALAFSSFSPALADQLPSNSFPVQTVNQVEILGSIEVSPKRDYVKMVPFDFPYSIYLVGKVNVIKRPRVIDLEGGKAIYAEFKVGGFFPEVHVISGGALIGDPTRSNHFLLMLSAPKEVARRAGDLMSRLSPTPIWKRERENGTSYYFFYHNNRLGILYYDKEDAFFKLLVVERKDGSYQAISYQFVPPYYGQAETYEVEIKDSVLEIVLHNKEQRGIGKVKINMGNTDLTFTFESGDPDQLPYKVEIK